MTGNQRSNYKTQRAQMQLEQSKRVTCAAGQKNANVGTLAMGLPWPLALPELLPLIGIVALVMLGGFAADKAAGGLLDWVDEALDFIPISITQETKPTEHDSGDIEVWSGDVVDANGHAVSFAGGGNLVY